MASPLCSIPLTEKLYHHFFTRIYNVIISSSDVTFLLRQPEIMHRIGALSNFDICL